MSGKKYINIFVSADCVLDWSEAMTFLKEENIQKEII